MVDGDRQRYRALVSMLRRCGVIALHPRPTQRTVDGPRSQAGHGSSNPAIHAYDNGSTIIVALAGEFDLTAVDPVREALTCAINEARPRLIIDLGGVTFIDSSGLHLLLALHRLCCDTESALTIWPGPPNVQRVFELTNLVDRLPFEIAAEPS